jgi:hypothetical protein
MVVSRPTKPHVAGKQPIPDLVRKPTDTVSRGGTP